MSNGRLLRIFNLCFLHICSQTIPFRAFHILLRVYSGDVLVLYVRQCGETDQTARVNTGRGPELRSHFEGPGFSSVNFPSRVGRSTIVAQGLWSSVELSMSG